MTLPDVCYSSMYAYGEEDASCLDKQTSQNQEGGGISHSWGEVLRSASTVRRAHIVEGDQKADSSN